MKNILTTIPKGKFANWATAERVCKMCDGTTERTARGFPEATEGEHEEGDTSPWFWLINTVNLPKALSDGAVCFMVYDGLIRGYFDIVDTDLSKNWGRHCESLPARSTQCMVMANWHPLSEPISQGGFQGWRYTELHP